MGFESSALRQFKTRSPCEKAGIRDADNFRDPGLSAPRFLEGCESGLFGSLGKRCVVKHTQVQILYLPP